MHITGQADIIPLLRHLCLALQPYACAQGITINFTTSVNSLILNYDPGKVIKDVSEILCAIISFLPNQSSINVKASIGTINDVLFFQLYFHNSWSNIAGIPEITNNINFPVSGNLAEANENKLTITRAKCTNNKTYIVSHVFDEKNMIMPVFFQEVQRRLKLYFTKPDPQVAFLCNQRPKDSAFLKRLNEVIELNINKENFDANALSKEMALSRAQLLRKIKPLISQSPGCYIKSLRLQKAKELLENDDLSVSEVAYKTGFHTPSHFTKVFIQKYGIRPSVFRRPRPYVTNE